MVCNLERRGLASRARASDVRRFVALALNRERYAPTKGSPRASTVADLTGELDLEEHVTLGAFCRKLGRSLADAASNGS